MHNIRHAIHLTKRMWQRGKNTLYFARHIKKSDTKIRFTIAGRLLLWIILRVGMGFIGGMWKAYQKKKPIPIGTYKDANGETRFYYITF